MTPEPSGQSAAQLILSHLDALELCGRTLEAEYANRRLTRTLAILKGVPQ